MVGLNNNIDLNYSRNLEKELNSLDTNYIIKYFKNNYKS